jgi:protein gp37
LQAVGGYGVTAIEWTDQTWNPVTGCSKVSAGCDHCYAETLALGRLKGKAGYPGLPWTPENAAVNVVLRPERLGQPLKWRKPSMVFVNSMSDLFHPRVPGDFIAQVFDVMERCPQHVFQVLTKRPKRMASWTWKFRPEPLPNVWLGTSIESREWVERADHLREASAAIRFVSAEPLLESLIDKMSCGSCWEWPDPDCDECEGAQVWNSMESLNLLDIDWLIVGGESGDGHRPIDAQWVRELRDECLELHELQGGPAFFFKQWGGRTPKAGGRDLDGRTWDEYPATPSEAQPPGGRRPLITQNTGSGDGGSDG